MCFLLLMRAMQYVQALNVLHQAGILHGETYVRLLTNRAACLLALHQPLRALQDCHLAVQVSLICH